MVQEYLKAYKGKESFIFVSYSHRDGELVYPEISRLNQMGFNVWYDEGIETGKIWADEIAQRIAKSSLIIYFVTSNSALSRHCSNEIHYSLELGKPILTIYLRPASLAPGLAMQLDLVQGIKKYEYSETKYNSTLEEFLRQFFLASQEANGTRIVHRLPLGIVTLMRVDFADSLGKATRNPNEYLEIVLKSHEILQAAVLDNGGTEVEIGSEYSLYVFENSTSAINTAVFIQRLWEDEVSRNPDYPRLRMALHTGQPKTTEHNYFGVDVLRVAKISSVGHPGQVLLSADTQKAVNPGQLSEEVQIRELGTHRIKDLPYPELLFDLAYGNEDIHEPLMSLANRPNNLPTIQTSFIGREKSIAMAAGIISKENARLLTLTGPGGMGKTRLSIEVAHRLEEQFKDGVFLVLLASITDPVYVISTIAETLGVVTCIGQTPMESLVKHLSSRRVLLVLDNFEQIVESASDILHLLDSCPNIAILVSSRQTLDLRIEREFPVEPLTLPELTAVPDVEGAMASEAVQLFIQRAQDQNPGFALDAENVNDIVEICNRLDGLPLGLELAASRMAVLSARQLAENLNKGFRMLKSRSRDLPERQQTLRNVVKWSYDLLDADEQALFLKLSIFRGSYSFSAVQYLLAREYDEIELLDGMESLIRKSLLNKDTSYVEPRFWMLESIREFGAALFQESDDFEEISERHAEYFLQLSEFLAPGLILNQQRQSVTCFMIDLDNIRTGLSRVIDTGNLELSSRYLKSLQWLWISKGNFTEGLEWVNRAIAKFNSEKTDAETSVINEVSGWLLALSGNYQMAEPFLEKTLESYKLKGTDEDIARAKTALGITKSILGSPQGLELSEEGLAMYNRIDDKYGIILGLVSTGVGAMLAGDLKSATEKFEHALDVCSELGNTFWPGQVLQNLGHFKLMEQDWQQAATHFVNALNISIEFDYPTIRDGALAGIGGVAVLRNKPREAARIFGSVQANLNRLGVELEPPTQAAMNVYLEATRVQLSDAEYQEAFNEGMLWGEKEVINAVSAISH